MTRRILAGSVATAVLAASGLVLARPASPGAEPATQAPGNPILVLDTAKGAIEIELLQSDAPKSVDYIVDLVKKGFYRGQRFHRVERSLVQVGDIQSRDVTKKAWWGRNVHIPTIGVAEISKKLVHARGIVGLAHSGNATQAHSQFYIMKVADMSLNGKYTIIGRVKVGMPTVDTIQISDVIKNATIKEAAPK